MPETEFINVAFSLKNFLNNNFITAIAALFCLKLNLHAADSMWCTYQRSASSSVANTMFKVKASHQPDIYTLRISNFYSLH